MSVNKNCKTLPCKMLPDNEMVVSCPNLLEINNLVGSLLDE